MDMNDAPLRTQVCEAPGQGFKDSIRFLKTESVTFPQYRRSFRTMQVENSLTVRSDDVNVRRAMVVRSDDDAQASETKNGRHSPV